MMASATQIVTLAPENVIVGCLDSCAASRKSNMLL